MPAVMDKPISSHDIPSCITAMENHPSDPYIWVIGRMDGIVMLFIVNEDEFGFVGSITLGMAKELSPLVGQDTGNVEKTHYEAVQSFAFSASNHLHQDSNSNFISVALDGLILPWTIVGRHSLISSTPVTISSSSLVATNQVRQNNIAVGISDLKISGDGKLCACQSQAGHIFELNEYQLDQLVNNSEKHASSSLISFRYCNNGALDGSSSKKIQVPWNLPKPVSRIALRVSRTGDFNHFSVTDATGSILIYRQGESQPTHSIVPPEPAYLVSWCKDNDRILAVATTNDQIGDNDDTASYNIYLYNFDLDLTQPWITLARTVTCNTSVSSLDWGPFQTTSSQKLFAAVSSRILVWSVPIPCPNQRKPIPWLVD
jgi:hypothetical protein